MSFTIIFLIFVVILLIWNASLLISVLSGAPTVYAKKQVIGKALELSEIKSGQTVLDLGCGNARSLIIAAQKFKARGVGVEISPFYYLLARLNVRFNQKSKDIKIIFGNLLNQKEQIKQADVIYLYLFEKLLDKLEPVLNKNAKKGTKIISIGFKLKTYKPVFISENPKIFIYKV